MNSNSEHPNDMTERETLPEGLIAALRALPSERVVPLPGVDAAILAEAGASLTSLRRRRFIHRIWPPLAVAAGLAIAFILFSKHSLFTPENHIASTTEDPYALILREVNSLFPHQVRAITTDGSQLQILLSEEPLTGSAQAVVIEACGAGGCTVVITYVGQTIEIERQQITVLAGEDGVVILEKKKPTSSDLQIKSRTI